MCRAGGGCFSTASLGRQANDEGKGTPVCFRRLDCYRCCIRACATSPARFVARSLLDIAAMALRALDPLLREQPFDDVSLRPAHSAGTVAAEEAEVSAVLEDPRLDVRRQRQRLERLDRHERIIARRQ